MMITHPTLVFTHPTGQDWLEIFLDHGYKYVWESLMAITSMLPVDYLNVDEAIEGIAAAAVIASALNRPLPGTPPELLAWIPGHPLGDDPELVQMARDALARVLADSELKEQWEAGGDAAAWHTTTLDLQNCLNQQGD